MQTTTAAKEHSPLLAAAAVYFLLCGLSAIVWPKLWYIASGIPGEPPEIALAVAGAMMIALALAAWLAFRESSHSKLVLSVLLCANGLDCVIVMRGLLLHQLPSINASAFIILDLIWCFLLFRKLQEVKKKDLCLH